MRKYIYKNATVYITEPTERQLQNIVNATERFAKQLVKRRLINGSRKANR